MPANNAVFHFSLRLSIPKDKDRAYAEGAAPDVRTFLTEGLGADKFIFQLEDSFLEKSEEEKAAKACLHNLHFQCWFHVEKKVRASYLIKILQASQYAKWSSSLTQASIPGKESLRRYCMKSSTRVAGPWADREIYLGADLITPSRMVKHQRALLEYLLKFDPVKCGRRMTIWVFCPEGGSGKSAFKKYCAFKKGWPGFTYAKAADLLYLVSKFPNKRVYFFNLSKTKSADVSEQELYAAIESVKDGDFVSTKYECEFVLMNPCHTVVFANHLPKLDNMTRGRFKILRWNRLPESMMSEIPEFDFGCEEITEAQCREIQATELALESPRPKKRQRLAGPEHFAFVETIEARKAPG